MFESQDFSIFCPLIMLRETDPPKVSIQFPLQVCLEFMCWLENLNDLYMSIDYGKALNIFRRQESRFKLVLYECLKVGSLSLLIYFELLHAVSLPFCYYTMLTCFCAPYIDSSDISDTI